MIKSRYLLLPPIVLCLCAGLLRADLDAVKAERRLEKRSEKALKNADKMLDVARGAYLEGDAGLLKSALAEVRESVELSYQSLKETGKNPRRRSKPYKRGEISTRKLLRRLDTLRGEMSYLERDQTDAVIEVIQKVHDDFLRDIMAGGKR